MDGGTFTVSNGGVFGSMFGTPIINPPQSAILGMHAVFDRPVAINGKVSNNIEWLYCDNGRHADTQMYNTFSYFISLYIIFQ